MLRRKNRIYNVLYENAIGDSDIHMNVNVSDAAGLESTFFLLSVSSFRTEFAVVGAEH